MNLPGRATIAEMSRPGGPATREGSAGVGRALAEERSSFGYAFQGVRYAWQTQRHLRIHAGLAAVAAVLGLLLRVSAAEWAILVAVIALVTALELLNTVVEVVVDMVMPYVDPRAKVAKDVAAGAVLVASAGAVLVAAALFLPRIWALVRP